MIDSDLNQTQRTTLRTEQKTKIERAKKSKAAANRENIILVREKIEPRSTISFLFESSFVHDDSTLLLSLESNVLFSRRIFVHDPQNNLQEEK